MKMQVTTEQVRYGGYFRKEDFGRNRHLLGPVPRGVSRLGQDAQGSRGLHVAWGTTNCLLRREEETQRTGRKQTRNEETKKQQGV